MKIFFQFYISDLFLLPVFSFCLELNNDLCYWLLVATDRLAYKIPEYSVFYSSDSIIIAESWDNFQRRGSCKAAHPCLLAGREGGDSTWWPGQGSRTQQKVSWALLLLLPLYSLTAISQCTQDTPSLSLTPSHSSPSQPHTPHQGPALPLQAQYMMETRYNPVSTQPLPHARTGERERERERELSDLSQSGSGKAGMGTGEEDTAQRLSHPPASPLHPSTLPHWGTGHHLCFSVQSCKPPGQWGAGWQWLPWSDCCRE